MSTHIIEIKLEKEEDLYHPLDPNGRLLSDEAKAYLYDRLLEKRLGDEIELHVLSDGPVDQNKVETAVWLWADTELESMRRESKRNILKQVRLIVFGLIFITASLVLKEKIPTIWVTVLATVGSFSIWEATSIMLVQNPRIRNRRLKLRWLKEHMNIVFEGSEKVASSHNTSGKVTSEDTSDTSEE